MPSPLRSQLSQVERIRRVSSLAWHWHWYWHWYLPGTGTGSHFKELVSAPFIGTAEVLVSTSSMMSKFAWSSFANSLVRFFISWSGSYLLKALIAVEGLIYVGANLRLLFRWVRPFILSKSNFQLGQTICHLTSNFFRWVTPFILSKSNSYDGSDHLCCHLIYIFSDGSADHSSYQNLILKTYN